MYIIMYCCRKLCNRIHGHNWTTGHSGKKMKKLFDLYQFFTFLIYNKMFLVITIKETFSRTDLLTFNNPFYDIMRNHAQGFICEFDINYHKLGLNFVDIGHIKINCFTRYMVIYIYINIGHYNIII